MASVSAFITEVMCDRLAQLALVPSFSYAEAYQAAFEGIQRLRPTRNPTDAEYVEGCVLAMELWSRRMTATLAARREADEAVGA
ncbi:MAG: hypothetical protein ACRDQW_17495 [Haloechinothrix sp.]